MSLVQDLISALAALETARDAGNAAKREKPSQAPARLEVSQPLPADLDVDAEREKVKLALARESADATETASAPANPALVRIRGAEVARTSSDWPIIVPYFNGMRIIPCPIPAEYLTEAARNLVFSSVALAEEELRACGYTRIGGDAWTTTVSDCWEFKSGSERAFCVRRERLNVREHSQPRWLFLTTDDLHAYARSLDLILCADGWGRPDVLPFIVDYEAKAVRQSELSLAELAKSTDESLPAPIGVYVFLDRAISALESRMRSTYPECFENE